MIEEERYFLLLLAKSPLFKEREILVLAKHSEGRFIYPSWSAGCT